MIVVNKRRISERKEIGLHVKNNLMARSKVKITKNYLEPIDFGFTAKRQLGIAAMKIDRIIARFNKDIRDNETSLDQLQKEKTAKRSVFSTVKEQDIDDIKTKLQALKSGRKLILDKKESISSSERE